ncbi:hypothetical protein C2G38_2169128 [Gigaspora rosea]|uniref:Uncharacterized protein n=1 Tax=Gigaspora rosea TaxID=44941 RepID=A0A397VT94_9GLOM|nr:hypothetical protein C2G38_2169128 [Gigaspora rosea]
MCLSDNRNLPLTAIKQVGYLRKTHLYSHGETIPEDQVTCREYGIRAKPYQEVAVILGSRVDEIINKYIKNDCTKAKLKAIVRSLEKYRDLQIYADSSVNIESQDLVKKRLGIGFVVSKIDNQAIEEEVSFARALED